MIGRKSQRKETFEDAKPMGFDDFELRLGDVMRGERATLGKSLLDVQRELRIKASYIAAIENCDPSAFDTPGFIAGYVRSYARYLNMDPDDTFAAFCAESGFATAHGMSEKASVIKKREELSGAPKPKARDPFAQPSMSFVPQNDSLLSRIEPGAIGSSLVLLLLIGGIGFGGWSVLQEVQRVQLAPVEQTPVVLSDLDPLDGAVRGSDAGESTEGETEVAGVFTPPSNEALDRLYRPQALDVPVLVARDAPISTLDPRSVGAFAEAAQRDLPEMSTPDGSDTRAIDRALAEAVGGEVPSPQVLEDSAPGVTMLAVRPAWVRVRAADGTVIYEAIMNAGDTYQIPQTQDPATLRVGESGAIYFAMGGQTYGPAGARGQVTSNLSLSVANLTDAYSVAAIEQDQDLARVVAELNAPDPVAEQ
ncbi:helix-turn-helix domain-containing protein [Thalassococcus profundi]|uniref:Helix-turn-helix domain-containing protein n=2 Tax=Thalassococcus profundi TaxID=2282382 RepID=A0A369TNY2_9RHOB|nr:helix-turn-helix domain-containing protein [Thalassococcus profundi]RDD66562.1 helix-turn-helix domain-containing protein [Thalassococcus profundi]